MTFILVLIYGPSCVGKTTLFHMLKKFDYIDFVTCYTTREIRNDDIKRIQVSLEVFDEMAKDKKFAFINKHFNTYYGTSLDDIKRAINDKFCYYILDFKLENSTQLNQYNPISIILIPESKKQLLRQIKESGRVERVKEIVHDYVVNYSNEKLEDYKRDGFFTVTNYPNQIQRCFNEILNILGGQKQ